MSDLVRLKYGYDGASNRLYRRDESWWNSIIRRFRYRTRTLMLIMATIGPICIVLKEDARRCEESWRHEQQLIAELQPLGTTYETRPRVATWYNPFVDRRFSTRVIRLAFLSDIRRMNGSNPEELDKAARSLTRVVPQLCYLETLGLEGYHITDAQLQAATQLPNLTNLWLINTSVTVRGLTNLSRAKALESLSLENVGARIYEALPLSYETTVNQLNSGNAGDDNSDSAQLAFAKEIVRCRKLKKLSLSGPVFSSWAIEIVHSQRSDIQLTVAAFTL